MTEGIEKAEVFLKGIKRPDAVTKFTAVEIERSGSKAALYEAAVRLKESGKPQKVLIVPGQRVKAAKSAMQEVGVSGTLRNFSDTRRIYVVGNRSARKKQSC
jgi:hypothetical protein